MVKFQNKQDKKNRVRDSGRAQREREAAQNPASFRVSTTLKSFHHDATEELARNKTRKLRMRRRRLGVLLLTILIICAFGIFVLSQFTGSLNSVKSNVSNLSVDDSKYYKKLVNEYFMQNPFERFTFGRRNQALTEYIASRAPEISSVKITFSGLMNSDLRLIFREPVAMWINNQTTSYVDKSGAVFEKNLFATPNIDISDESGVSPTDGVATSSRFLSFIGQVVTVINNDESINHIVIPRGAIRYVEIYLNGREYPFKAQIDRDPVMQAADILAMVKYLDDNNIAPKYVDCRVAGKAYWK